ncbi:MAG: C45 family peptidase, partial [Methanosarcinaceae archaeon]|nr:C45 family peptidase [Methanosarcinaceae archaeon]
MDRYFPVIKIHGEAAERGRQHGSLLKERIHRTLEFYQQQFQLPEQDILGIADQFRKSTEAYREAISIEIDALARAAEVDPLWIYALNGRTELLNLNPMECTALVFKKQRLMGQNWDWHSEMEELAVILDIEKEDGHRILTMTEPGMIGKIGMNHCGVGVCLNFMTIENYQPFGVPLHVILRSILDSKSVNEAQALIRPHLRGKVGNIVISNGTGNVVDLELGGDEFFSIPIDDLFVHTNHFLTKINYDFMLFPSSTGRYNRAKELLSQLEVPSIDSIKDILKDRGNVEAPICRTHFSHPLLTDDMSITV